MTVIPDDHLMTLICDTCGVVTTGPTCVLPDAEVVWTFVSEHGWSGSPFATGPHRCPRCSLLPPGAVEPGDDAGRRDNATGTGAGADYLDGITATDGHLDINGPLRGALTEVVDQDGCVIVDLSQVNVIDSTGLGLLVRAHREARQRGSVLCLVAPSRFVRTVLHTMRLEAVFPVFATRREALAAAPAAMGTERQTVHVPH